MQTRSERKKKTTSKRIQLFAETYHDELEANPPSKGETVRVGEEARLWQAGRKTQAGLQGTPAAAVAAVARLGSDTPSHAS